MKRFKLLLVGLIALFSTLVFCSFSPPITKAPGDFTSQVKVKQEIKVAAITQTHLNQEQAVFRRQAVVTATDYPACSICHHAANISFQKANPIASVSYYYTYRRQCVAENIRSD